jgi:hypothetical protein
MTKEEKRKMQKVYNKRYFETPKGKKKRYELRQKYYERTRFLSGGKKRKWTSEEITTLLNFDGTDEELAFELGRSCHAIENKRRRLKGEPKVV